jgi:CxxC-x17-CxxC domain-containing protein
LYTDERLTCTDCGAEFIFSAGEQEFFATKGFQNKPNRCPDCRAARKSQRGGGAGGGSGRSGGYGGSGAGGGGRYGGSGGGAREMYAVTCSACGQSAEVPFQPRGDKPVYCRDCFAKQRSSYR